MRDRVNVTVRVRVTLLMHICIPSGIKSSTRFFTFIPFYLFRFCSVNAGSMGRKWQLLS